MKKLLKVLCASLMFFSSAFIFVRGEDTNDFASNPEKYRDMCTKPNSALSLEEQATCKAYIQYESDHSADLRKQLAEIESKREEIAANIKEYAEKIRGYDKQIAVLRSEINDLNSKISVLADEIVAKETEIQIKQDEIAALKEKVKGRMVIAQRTMRINQYLDIIIGAKDFNDLLRRTSGINEIMNHDQATMNELKVLIEELNKVIAELEVAKADLDSKKQEVVNKQNTLLYYRSEAEVVRQEYLKKEVELEAEGNRIAGDLESIKATLSELTSALGQIAMSSGFVRPISGGRVSAGTWYYPESFGRGVHLGMDFAASTGTPIYAAGNGVVIKSADGCGVGGLGNSCGGNIGGSSGGGNQVYLLTRIDNSLYAVKYLHMNAGSPIATGSIVTAGQQIGAVGSSGNSTGAHVHVEVFYLGSGTIVDYAQKWNGDLAFGANWSYAALNRLCENGVGAPCRIKPESVFGG